MSQDGRRLREGEVWQEICPADRIAANPGSLHVRRSGWLRESKGFHLVKMNLEYNLHFAVAGRGVVVIDGVKREMAAGDAFMFFPGHRMDYYDLPGSRWEYYWVALRAPEGMQHVLDAALEAVGISEASPKIAVSPDSELWSFFPKLHRRIREGAYGGLFPVAAAWRLLDALSMESGAVEPSLAERLRNYVDGLDGALGVKELAERFNVSRATLHRVFSGSYGESLKSYMQTRRFQGACELLSGTALDIRQVASETGFRSAQYFCRAFKGRFGVTPGEWRRRRV